MPYGITANTGWVNVGTDHDTTAFAIESIRRWWHTRGSHDYPAATQLMITANAGGSNGYRSRTFKTELAALAAETGLAIMNVRSEDDLRPHGTTRHLPRLVGRTAHHWAERPRGLDSIGGPHLLARPGRSLGEAHVPEQCFS